MVLSLATGSYLTFLCWLGLSWILKGVLMKISRILSLNSSLFPGTLLCTLWPLYISSSVILTFPRFFSSFAAAWKLCPGSTLLIGAHLIYLMFLRGHCPLLPHSLCLESHCFIYFAQFLVVSGRRVNLISAIPFWSEAKFLR